MSPRRASSPLQATTLVEGTGRLSGFDHEARVRAWFGGGGPTASPDLVVRRFEEGFARVWERACPTLGDTTLVAITDRVLHDMASKHPALADVQVAASGLRTETLDGLREVDPATLEAALPEVLSQLLEVVGRLTAEILTPALHAALEVRAEARPREREAVRDESSRGAVARASNEKDGTS